MRATAPDSVRSRAVDRSPTARESDGRSATTPPRWVGLSPNGIQNATGKLRCTRQAMFAAPEYLEREAGARRVHDGIGERDG